MFVISQLCLTSHPKRTVVLLNTGTRGTSREIYSEDADDSFPAIAFELFSLKARSLGLQPRGCEFDPHCNLF